MTLDITGLFQNSIVVMPDLLANTASQPPLPPAEVKRNSQNSDRDYN